LSFEKKRFKKYLSAFFFVNNIISAEAAKRYNNGTATSCQNSPWSSRHFKRNLVPVLCGVIDYGTKPFGSIKAVI
jgi:hypothetical protein